MRFRPAVILLGILGAALAACAGGSKGGAMLPAAPSPTSSAAAKGSGKNVASFVITIPKATPTPAGARRPAYVSPATQSMTVSVLQGSTSVLSETAGLTATSPGCTTSLAGVTCTLTMNLDAGTYTASITTYDGTNGTGNALSTAQNLSFKVNANQNNVVPFSLSGIPANIIAMTGNTSNTVDLVAQDADGNFIIGSGAPTFTATASGTIVATMAQPSAAPNTIVFTLASPAPSPGTERVSVTAGYPSGTNGCLSQAACTLATPITVSYAGGTAFLANYEDNNTLGFSVPLTSNTQAPSVTFSNLGLPYGGVAVSSNGTLFTWGYETSGSLAISSPPYTTSTTASLSSIGISDEPYFQGAVAPNGYLFMPEDSAVAILAPPYTGPATQLSTGIDYAYGAATDSNSNLYIANDDNATVTMYAYPYTSTSATVATTEAPYGIAASGTKLFVTENGDIDIFNLPLTSSSTPVATLSVAGYSYGAAAVDSKGNLWVACYADCADSTDGEVYEFTTPFLNSESPTVRLTMPAPGFSSEEPTGIGFDSAGNLYVENYDGGSGEGGLLEYAGTIASSSKPTYAVETSNFDSPFGMALVPATFSVTP